MDRSSQTFFFEGYSLDPNTQRVQFEYSYDGDLTFTETWQLHLPSKIQASELIDRVLFSLHLAVGISYWKAYCPKQIEILSGMLTKEQADFWNTLYTKGLGEFFYKNNIDFRGLVNFPYTDGDESTVLTENPIENTPTGKTLVPLGGGKDSLTTITLLQGMNITFDTFTLGDYPVISEQVKLFGARHTHYSITRELSPTLFKLNQEGAINGHIPISSIYALAALLIAALKGHTYIALSNERSANEGNREYRGKTINHQWSKSLEFEQLLQTYMKKWITTDITYFSLLRPLSELHVAQLFAEQKQWHEHFTSCNTQFTIQSQPKQRWCGKCPKCLFVFTTLAPFINKEELVQLFGKNLFADKSLLPTMKALLGITDAKPFDCVGTPAEVTVAMVMTHENGEYEEDVIMEYFISDFLPTIENTEKMEVMKKEVFTVAGTHFIPKNFQSCLPKRAE